MSKFAALFEDDEAHAESTFTVTMGAILSKSE